jgi:beta-carotene ketolase (CrtO type)
VKEKLCEEVIRQWQWYVPNVTKHNLIGYYIYMLDKIARRDISMVRGDANFSDGIASQMGRFRPIPELSDYRMPVENMYLCSSSMAGYGGLKGIAGPICHKVIAQYFGLRKVWEEKGGSYW